MSVAGKTIHIGIFKNNVEVAGSETITVFGANTEWNSMETFAFIPGVNTTDQITIKWESDGTTTATMADHRFLVEQIH
jgi:hypothetical protein